MRRTVRAQLGRISSIMTKPNQSMRCAVCHRPLERAAALRRGLPVGRVCAIKQGLIQPRAASLPGELDLVHTIKPEAIVRDTLTVEMFPT